MQLNPSTDFYDAYEDDDSDDSAYDNNEDDRHYGAALVAREPVGDEEEEDMGYDEDDERIGITVERPKELPTLQAQKDHNTEEGSASGTRGKINEKSNSDGSPFIAGKQNNFQSEQNLWTENGKGDEVDSREGSGNFANDDDEDDDDGDEDVSGEDSRNSDDFFNSKRSKSSSRYFRKNNNDAIKIISTPLGKVGIVYQQSPTDHLHNSKVESTEKKATAFTDFDALSPDPESSRRLASSHPKITPVLTPDGKVALLYRGDSENSKYEPIRNLTHKFNKSNNSSTDKTSANTEGHTNNYGENNEARESNAEDSEERSEGIDNLNSSEYENRDGGKATDNKHIVDEQRTDTSNNGPTLPTTGTFAMRPPDSILPMINRPLSEVLGIKKNQFKQFRVKDVMLATTESNTRQLTGTSANSESNLHFLTKVNLADYPTSARSRNFDFDFSRDNTMLDERRRNKEIGQNQQINENVDVTSHSNTIANEEVLSKTEVVNLAIIPHFDEEFERLQRLRDHENRRHHRQRHRHKQSEEDLSGIHCIMQAMMGIAAISTVFGMLGTFFKQRILDQIRLMHW